MEVTKETTLHIADLAKLRFSDEECEKLTSEMQSIIGFAAKLGECDVEDIDITAHIVDKQNVLRDDVVEPSFDRDKILANAPQKYAGCFKVPKIVE